MPTSAGTYYHPYEGSEEGQKPPVVLIHGAGGTHLYWPSDVRRLPGYRVYAIDLPGHGKSEGRVQQSINAYTEDVLSWMDALGLHRAVFIGHSMGSAISLSLALDHPEQVLGLGLIGAGARLRVSPEITENASSSTTFHNAIQTLITQSFSENTPRKLVDQAAKRMAETRFSVLYGDLLACDAFDVMDRVSDIRCATLVLCGEDDQMTPKRYSQFLADQIPSARLQLVPEAGHMVMLEKPKMVADIILEFLDGIYF